MGENERLHSALTDLGGFIRYMAGSESVLGGHWFLNKEDLESEAYLLLLDLTERYEFVNYNEFLKICRKSIVNKFKSLKGKYLRSNRRHDHYAVSFEDAAYDGFIYSEVIGFSENSIFGAVDFISDDVYSSSLNPSARLTHFSELYECLMDFDLSILDCLLGRNGRVVVYLHLVISRSKFMKSEKCIRINEYVIARALCCHIMDVREGFDRIKHAIIERSSVNG